MSGTELTIEAQHHLELWCYDCGNELVLVKEKLHSGGSEIYVAACEYCVESALEELRGAVEGGER